MDEPIWLSRQVVEILQFEQIVEHGGRPGLRDQNALEAALARPRQLFTYRRRPDLPRLAAAQCIGIAEGHPFIDGNKRAALLATYAFLSINGLVLDADETEAAQTVEGAAAGVVNEQALARWIRAHVK